MVPTHSKRLASVLGNADCKEVVVVKVAFQRKERTIPGEEDIYRCVSIKRVLHGAIRTIKVISSFPSLKVRVRVRYDVFTPNTRRLVTLPFPSFEAADD